MRSPPDAPSTTFDNNSPIIAVGVKDAGPTYIGINAVNCGPGNTTLSLIILGKTSLYKWLPRKQESGVVIPDYENPASGNLPCELGVGERILLLFPYDSECFLKENMPHVGISDTFGRTHWMKTSEVKKMNARWRKEFKAST